MGQGWPNGTKRCLAMGDVSVDLAMQAVMSSIVTCVQGAIMLVMGNIVVAVMMVAMTRRHRHLYRRRAPRHHLYRHPRHLRNRRASHLLPPRMRLLSWFRRCKRKSRHFKHKSRRCKHGSMATVLRLLCRMAFVSCRQRPGAAPVRSDSNRAVRSYQP